MIAAIGEKITLNNYQKMPGYGFGCYKAEGAELIAAIGYALSNGYRMLDTASYYGNEETVGEALKKLPTARNTYIISKIWPSEFANPVKALDRTLKDLGLEQLNAYLLHWPGLDEKLRLRAFETLLRQQEDGKIITLGVSNFYAKHLETLHREFGIWAPINQIECHPYYPQQELCDFCASHNMAVMAWSPLGRGNELNNPALVEMAQKVKKSVAQIILRWHVQHNRVPIPKSVHKDRIAANAEIFNFSLTPEQMLIIDNLAKPGVEGRRGPDPLAFPT